MKRRATGAPRRSKTAATRRGLLVFTEGEKTEDGYLLPWRRQYRDSVLITIDPFHGTPRSLVDRAVETKRAESRDERRGRGRAHDEIWCVFDIDEHPNIPDAIQKAEAHGIQLAISNPCIELWFILHFEDHTAYLDRHVASRGRQRSCSVERHSRLKRRASSTTHSSLRATVRFLLTASTPETTLRSGQPKLECLDSHRVDQSVTTRRCGRAGPALLRTHVPTGSSIAR